MSKREDFLVFGSPLIEEPEIEEVVKTIRSGWIGTGPKVGRFEDMFAEYVGTHDAIAVNSCTAALHLCILAAGIQPGDEVITTPMTFCATANAIIHSGGVPVFVDVNIDTMNIDETKIEAAITDKTKAIIPVHFAGRPCEMDTIMAIARKHNLYVIEDAAHCVEGEYKGRKVGNIGDATCFSFYVTKNITTAEGGMITTNHNDWVKAIKVNALHGMTKDAWKRYSDEGFKHYQVISAGFKYNMTDIQASFGIHQLGRVEQYYKRRMEIVARYNEAFAELAVITPVVDIPEIKHALHLYTLLVKTEEAGKSRDVVQSELQELNIGTGIHYIALHLHPFYAEKYGYSAGDFPNAEYISDRTISLPLSAKLTDKDVDDVIEAVQKVFGQ